MAWNCHPEEMFFPYVISSDFNRSGCFPHQEMVEFLEELILTRQD